MYGHWNVSDIQETTKAENTMNKLQKKEHDSLKELHKAQEKHEIAASKLRKAQQDLEVRTNLNLKYRRIENWDTPILCDQLSSKTHEQIQETLNAKNAHVQDVIKEQEGNAVSSSLRIQLKHIGTHSCNSKSVMKSSVLFSLPPAMLQPLREGDLNRRE